MKATMEFQLPEEQENLEAAMKAFDFKFALNDFAEEMQQKISILLADKMFDYEINQKSSFGSITLTKSIWFLKGH